MPVVARSRLFCRKSWLALLACGPLVVAGCGGDSAEPVETAATTPPANGAAASPESSHGAPAQPGGGHGGGGHGGGGEAPSGGPGSGHGAPMMSDGPGSGHGGAQANNAGPGSGHDGAEATSSGPGSGHGGPMLSGGPGAGHDAPVSSGPGSGHAGGEVASSGPGSGHGAPMANSGPGSGHAGGEVAAGPGSGHGGPATNGGPAAGHDEAVASSGDVGGKPKSTGEWLSGLASGLTNGNASTDGAAGSEIPMPGAETEMPADIPTAAGAESTDGEGGSGGQAQQFAAGTAEHAVQQLVLKLQAGDTSGLSDLISERSTDSVLQPIREGKSDAALVEKVKTMASGAQLVSMRDGAGTKTFVVRNGAGQMLTITAKREGEVYRVFSVKVAAPPRGRR